MSDGNADSLGHWTRSQEDGILAKNLSAFYQHPEILCEDECKNDGLINVGRNAEILLCRCKGVKVNSFERLSLETSLEPHLHRYPGKHSPGSNVPGLRNHGPRDSSYYLR